jgi:hypothetical protein
MKKNASSTTASSEASSRSWCAPRPIPGGIGLGAHQLRLAPGLAAGGAGEAFRGLVGLAHRLGQFAQLGRELAQFARRFARPGRRRGQHQVAQRAGRGQSRAQHQQRGQEARHPQPPQQPHHRAADQGEEHRQQHRQQHRLRRPQGIADRQRGQHHHRGGRTRPWRRRAVGGVECRGGLRHGGTVGMPGEHASSPDMVP